MVLPTKPPTDKFMNIVETRISPHQEQMKLPTPRRLKAGFVAAVMMALLLPAALRVHASLVLEWKLDETNGSPTVADSSGNGNVGMVTNATFLHSGGILGGCVQFAGANGVDQRIYMNPAPAALTTAPYQYPITASVWSKNNVASGSGQLMSFGVNIGNIYHACRQTGLLDERANGIDNQIGTAAAANTGWNNVVCVWTATNQQAIYVNGVLSANGAVYGVTNKIVTFAIGSLYRQIGATPANPYAGLMDDVAVWDQALTDQQIAAIYGLGHFSAGNASDMPRFLAAFTAGTNVALNGVLWTPTNGLPGNLGSVGGTVAATNAYVILDGFGDGMQVLGSAVPPLVSSFVITPSQVFAGDTPTLSWTVGSANYVTIDQGIGQVLSTGGQSIITPTSSVPSSITWTLVATNAYGATTNSATLNILPTPGPLKLAVHWNLDEASGTTATNSLGTNVTGQFVVGTNIPPAWEPAGGYIGGDLLFTTANNSNNVAVRADLGGVTLTNYPFALAAWVNTQDVLTRNETVISLVNSNASDQYYCLQVDAGQARLAIRNGVEIDTYGGFVYGSGTFADWHYIVADFERDSVRNIYVDGNLVTTGTDPAGGFFAPNRFSAGAIDRQIGIVNPYTGHADELALFTGTLTADQVHIFYGAMTGLGLNTAEIDTLRNAFLQTNTATVHNAAWVPATGLSGSAGTTGGGLATQNAYIVMDSNGNGVQISTTIPAISGITPSSPVVGSSGSQTLNVLGVNFQSGCTVALTNADTSTPLSPTMTFVNSSNLTINVNLGVAPHHFALQVINPGNIPSSLYSFTVVAPPQPRITGIRVLSGNVTLSGTNGTVGLTYSVLVSTNLAQPLVNWTPLGTNTFGVGGSFSWTNPIVTSKPQLFYIIKP